MSRRQFIRSSACAALVGGSVGWASRRGVAAQSSPKSASLRVESRFKDLERSAEGRLGVHILDTSTGEAFGYRSDERFMMLSSFKLLASALVLHRVDAGQDSLDRRIAFRRDDLISWSPVTEKQADGPGMTLAELCAATITTSDNTAANLILASYGGPPALTAYARQLGDIVTRLDRIEPDLNMRQANGLLDTTSPRAMAHTIQSVVLGAALSTQSRERLQQWLLGNTTGGKRLKAGIPPDWRIGDKTGTNQTDANDIGIIWPENRAPIVVTAYLAESSASKEVKDSTLAACGRIVSEIAGRASPS
jgi:beta-lactamase class A